MICNKCKLEFPNAGIKQHENKCNLNHLILKNIKNDYFISNLTIREVCKKYKITNGIFYKIIDGKSRNLSSAKKVSKKPPFKHTDESKAKLRKIRLEWMKNNPTKTAWRLSNMSYPEKIFNEYLINNEYNKKYLIIREKSIFPYYIDFAFENIKLAVEIDGSQHQLKERIELDKQKDNLLKSLGWNVLRIKAYSLIYDFNNTIKLFELELNNIINNSIFISNISIGIYNNIEYKNKEKEKKKQQKSIKKENDKLIKINKILISNIDFSKYGWVNKVSEILNIKPQKTSGWIKKNMYGFWLKNCFKRKS